eukprot:COSAG02_NODE_53954_length_298_cov_8.638191_1_plen_43_part_01
MSGEKRKESLYYNYSLLQVQLVIPVSKLSSMSQKWRIHSPRNV